LAADLQGQTALVTGAALRLGRDISLDLAQQGVNVVVHYNRSAETAEQVVAEIRALGVNAWSVQGDFAEPGGYEGLIDRVLAQCDSLDILVNSASIFPEGRLNDLSFGDVMTNVHVNAWAPFELSRQFAASGAEGAIVNLLDTRIRGFDFNHVAYILSKHMLASLTTMTAAEFAPRIRVNAVAPGLVLPPPGKTDSDLEPMATTLPLQTRGFPADVVDAVGFLLRSPFITGQVIYVDGGRHIREQGLG